MKRLVICCDGTWNSADQETDGAPCPTNVVKLAYRVAKRDGDVPQVVYYDQGVGTGNVLDRVTGGAFGAGLEDNIYDVYRFLIANYEPGDELYFFGFSRGAFTVRSAVGLIRKCGILAREHVQKYRDAIALYRSADEHPDDARPLEFRRSCSVTCDQPVRVRCVGVWDTVGALGIPMRGLRAFTRTRFQFHDTELSGIVENAFHALAIDERREPFRATLWDYKPKPGQRVEQAWFCGVHSDIGGGYPETGLSDIALEWMMERAATTGLRYDERVCAAHPLHPDACAPVHDSRKGFYLLSAGVDRPIGRAGRSADSDPNQYLHPSVLTRWDADGGYRPQGLLEYFRRTGDPRASR